MSMNKYRVLKRAKVASQIIQAISSHRLVVVSAPMGYGKTSLMREIREKAKFDTHLFSMPTDTSDAEALWDSLWEVMEIQGMNGAADLRSVGVPETSAHIREALRILSSAPNAVVILDDYHNSTVHALDVFLEAAAWLQTPACRFLLFSRACPDVKLDELRFKERAALFTQETLAFSKAEARQYFLINGVADMEMAENAWNYSEGWAAAMWLCLHNLRQGGAVPPSGDVESMLETAVFSTYSQADRLFLTQLSLLDSFTVQEAAEITLDRTAGRHLTRLRNKNAFITRNPARGHYQLHSIFRAFLQKKLKPGAGLNLADLFRRTAECHFARREYMTAVRLLVKAGRDKDRLRILEMLREQCGEGEVLTLYQREELSAIVQAIPWRIRIKEPLGYLSHIWLMIGYADREHDTNMLREAERRFHGAKDIPPEIKKRLTGEIEYIRGAYAYNDMPAMFRHYDKARELLNGPSFLQYERVSWTFSNPHMTSMLLRGSGEYLDLLNYIDRKQGTLSALTGESSLGSRNLSRAEYHLERGEFDAAERLLTELKEQADWRGATNLFLLVIFSRARLFLAMGKPGEATDLLANAARRIEKIGSHEHSICLAFARAYIFACIGRTDQVPGWIMDERVLGYPHNAMPTYYFLLIAHGKFLLERNDYDGLERLLERTSDDLGQFECLYGRIHKKIFEALLAKKRNGTEAAMEPFAAAIELSRPDGIVLSVAEYRDRVLPLARRLAKMAPNDEHLSRIVALCKRATQFSRESVAYKKSFLTQRERKIMRFLIKGKTTASIAQQLRVSESMIKQNLSATYAKLGVHTRVEAVGKYVSLYGAKIPERRIP